MVRENVLQTDREGIMNKRMQIIYVPQVFFEWLVKRLPNDYAYFDQEMIRIDDGVDDLIVIKDPINYQDS